MSSTDDTAFQQSLLATHRRTLAVLLSQQASLGPSYAPPGVINGIADCRDAIGRIKALLRERGAPADDHPDDEGAPATPAHPRPAPATALYQLRAPVGDFVDRRADLERLVQALSSAPEGANAIGVIRGLGGIGKTELAYAVAHRLRERFPDAQLLIELRGAGDDPMAPEQALQSVLLAFEPEARLPERLGELQGRYRTLLAGRRVLVVADDAASAEQVRWLIPPAGSALLVTSRHRFALPGMQTRDLATLPPAEAEQLLLEIFPPIGAHAAALARLCGYLPLALRVTASLLANGARSVERYVAQLEGARERLKAMRDPDDSSLDVEASLGLSYQALGAGAQSALGQLSVFSGSFDAAAARAVVQTADDALDVDEALDLLYRRSLIEWDPIAERFSLHDLVRGFAAAQGGDLAGAALRSAAHYLAVAQAAQATYLRGGEQTLAGLALFDRERVNIDASLRWCRQQQAWAAADEHLLAFASATIYLGNHRYDKRQERIPQLEAAIAAARRLGRRGDEGSLLGYLGLACSDIGELRRALACYEQGLAIAREVGDRESEGKLLGNLGLAYADLGDPGRALAYHEQQLGVAREVESRRTEAYALGGIGCAIGALGDPRRALDYHQQHLALSREIGLRQSESTALGDLGEAYGQLGEWEAALAHFEQQLAVARAIGNRRSEGKALSGLGRAYGALGEHERGAELLRQHLALARAIGDLKGEALTGWRLGRLLAAQGRQEEAAQLMRVRVDYERALGHPAAEEHAAEVALLEQRRG